MPFEPRRRGYTGTELDTETLPPVRSANVPDEPVVPGVTILCHPDPQRIGEQARLVAMAEGRPAGISRGEPELRHPGASSGRPLADPYLSRNPIVLRWADEGIQLCREQWNRALLIDGRPADEETSIPKGSLSSGVVVELAERVVLLLHLLGMPRKPGPSLGLVGESEVLESVRSDLRRVARTDVSVLLRGESGTGKELAASAIHGESPRADRPFLCLNMAAIPPSTAASELFGHVKGAFTGATKDAPGFFGRAHGGTLFLDEVGDTPPDIQVMLLRVLETGEIQPVGAQGTRHVNVRLLTATESNLEEAVGAGSFRLALLHRLAGYEIALPPLRRRRDDIGRLLVHFLSEELAAVGRRHRLDPPGRRETPPWLQAALVARLARYDFPGNVRELRNVARALAIGASEEQILRAPPSVERMLGLGASGAVSPDSASQASKPEPSQPEPVASSSQPPVEITEDLLVQALRLCKFRPGAAAKALGIGRTTIYKLMERSKAVRKAADIPEAELRRGMEEHGEDIAAMANAFEVSERALKLRLRRLVSATSSSDPD